MINKPATILIYTVILTFVICVCYVVNKPNKPPQPETKFGILYEKRLMESCKKIDQNSSYVNLKIDFETDDDNLSFGCKQTKFVMEFSWFNLQIYPQKTSNYFYSKQIACQYLFETSQKNDKNLVDYSVVRYEPSDNSCLAS